MCSSEAVRQQVWRIGYGSDLGADRLVSWRELLGHIGDYLGSTAALMKVHGTLLRLC